MDRRFRAIPEFGGRVLRVACLETADENPYLGSVLRPRCTRAIMKPTIKYQADDNALESSEIAPNVVFDYDVDGRIVGIELLNARAQLSAEFLSDAA
jgi:uncharacterized protein YuzE